ncbi:MAG: Do family serine endopeptidase [Hyphomicrobiaceae bacterium]
MTEQLPAHAMPAGQKLRWLPRGRSAAGAVVGALALAGALATWGATPAMAQLKADTPSIQTPFGRAPLTFADIVAKVKPAVVSIHVTNGERRMRRSAPGPRGRGQVDPFPDLPDNHPFNEFFKRFRKDLPDPAPRAPTLAQGSGFVISADGYVVTNNHVIDGAQKIQVSFDDREKLDAELVGTDPRTDLALLKIKAKRTFKFVRFSTEEPRVGDWVLAVGNPFGLGGTVTAGIVSAHGRQIGSGPYDFMQIDAAVNRGNSGGPTFNLKGDVVGVNTAIYSPSGGNVGIAFAVPAKVAMDVIEQLRSKGSVSRGWLGVKIQDLTDDIAQSLGLKDTKGAMISEATPGGPAEASGLKTRDTIVAVNGRPVANSRELARLVASLSPKTTAAVRIVRDGQERTVDVKLGEFPKGDRLAKLERGDDRPVAPPRESLGLSLAPAKTRPGAGEEGVVILKVDPASDAAQKQLRPGDVILEVMGESVSTAADVEKGVEKARKLGRKAVLLRVKSGQQQRYLGLQIDKG